MKEQYLKKEITKVCGGLFGCDVFSKSRAGAIMKHRKSIIYVLNKHYEFDPYQLEKITGIDRCTILYHIHSVENELKLYKDRRENVIFWTDVLASVIRKYNAIYEKVKREVLA